MNLVPRPAKHCTAAIVAANLSIISNVFEDAMTTFHSLTVAKVESETCQIIPHSCACSALS
ncbi:hypothetical protein DFY20_05935 [Escherichia coli]|nr:hypothetical protein [Escherichia coli]